jgi:drug/metabolite transporter (DMT)-like permease
MMIVGAYVGFSKLLVAVFPVLLLAWLRFGIAAVAMATWLKRGVDEPPLDNRSRYLLFLESFLGNFLFSICMLFGMRHASAISAGVIMAGIPAAVALLSWIFLREKLPGRMIAAIALAVVGVRSELRCHWQAAHWQSVAQTNKRADQSLGADPGDSTRRLGSAVV